MKLFVVWTLVLVLGNLGAGRQSLADGGGSKGLPQDGAASLTLEKTDVDPCRKQDEGGLKELPKVYDLTSMKPSLENGTHDTIKTVERRVINNTDEAGHLTGNKTVVEKTTETDVQPNRNVSKTTEAQVVVDEKGKESGEKHVTESETVTQSTPDNGTLTQTVDMKTVTDEKGNEINEEVVIKKEATVLTNDTKEKPKDDKAATLLLPKDDQGKNKTETTEITEERKETLPDNTTHEVLVKEKEEILPSQNSTKVTSVETKNITEKGDGLQKTEITEERKEILPSNITNEDVLKEEILPSQNSTKVTSVETKNITEMGDGLLKTEITEERKEILPSNITNEDVLKEEIFPSQNSTTVTSVETKNVTEKGDGLLKTEITEERKEILPSNITNEDVLKEEILPSQNSTTVTSVETKNITEKGDGLLRAEQTKERKETLPDNTTHEIVVKEKEEKLPSQDSTNETSVESKNVTYKGDGKDVEKETVIQKEVEKNVCNGDTKEVRDEGHLNETAEDLKHQVSDVKNKIEEEKAKAEETSPTPTQWIEQKPVAAPVIQEGKVVRKVVPAVRPMKVVRKVVPAVRPMKVVRKGVPSVRQGKVFVVHRVVEYVTPSVVTKRFPVVTQKKVLAKVPPTVTEGNIPVVTEKKVTENLIPSVTEGKVPVVTTEKVAEQVAPSATEEIVSVPKEQENVPVMTEKEVENLIPSVTEGKVPVVPQQEIVDKVAPSATEEIVSVPKMQENVPVVTEEKAENLIPSVTEGKVPVVPQQEIVDKVPPAATEEKVPVAVKEKVSEQAAPSGTEEIVTVPKEQEQVPVVTEEKVVEEVAPSVTEEKAPVVTNQTVVEKITPTATEEEVVTQRKLVEKVAPSVEENVVDIPKREEV
ncbi:titin-like isoform X50 [Eriocheir sinensis]|uniref:titin-like isoform X48 n=1 Tax=Eriocheir sinensis TaxID=95602 RepID=UPI0021C68DA6|nr:titin-like isoform X48 [Eriocheir sinensis]XP_050686953.1 titin-like isoform X49 [Eriocheir sinensis]XP_050686954.1 titin-like isoform X50 [Eriocheir sinensis]